METWTSRELPVLQALVDRFDDLETYSVRLHEVAELTEMDDTEVKRALRSLAAAEPPFIHSTGAAGLTYPLIVSGVTERAR